MQRLGFMLSICCLLLTTACAGGAKIQATRPTDKYLACNDIKMEMLEAESYRDRARKSTGPSLDNLLDGMGYVGTFISAETNIHRSEERLDHLGDLYRVKGCSYDTTAPAQMIAAIPVAPDPSLRRMPAGQVPQVVGGGGSPFPMAAAGLPSLLQGQPAPAAAYGYAPQPVMGGNFAQPALRPPEIGAHLLQ